VALKTQQIKVMGMMSLHRPCSMNTTALLCDAIYSSAISPRLFPARPLDLCLDAVFSCLKDSAQGHGAPKPPLCSLS
jgi:hypothetical protein